MGGMYVVDGKVQRLKIDRKVLEDLAKLLNIPTTGLQGISLHITAGRGAAGATPTASTARPSRSRSAASAATRRRK